MEFTNEENIELIIRSAMQNFSDLPVQCPGRWTVLQLKEHLQKIIPSKPDSKFQRLIYAGHCLDNSRTINSILKNRVETGSDLANVAQVFHLVYTSKEAMQSVYPASSEGLRHRSNASTSTATSNNGNSLSNQQNPQNFDFNAGGNAFDYYTVSYQNYLNQMIYYQQQLMLQQHGANVSLMNLPNVQQFFGAQNAMFGPNNGAFQFGGQVMVGAPLAFAGFHMNPGLFNGNAANPMFLPMNNLNNNGVNNNEAAVAQPIVAAADEDGQNLNRLDFLDIIYKTFRFALLMMVLYLYSSVERFFMVLLTISLIWFVQMHRERRNRMGQLNRQNNNDNNRANNAQNRNDVVNNLAADGDEESNNTATEDDVPVARTVENGQASVAGMERTVRPWNIFWSTVTSFFASLIPENPVPVNVN